MSALEANLENTQNQFALQLESRCSSHILLNQETHAVPLFFWVKDLLPATWNATLTYTYVQALILVKVLGPQPPNPYQPPNP